APLSKAIDRADYVVGLPAATLDALGVADADALLAHIAKQRAGAMTVVRDVKGIKRNIDVQQYLRAVEVGAGHQQLSRAGMAGGLVPLTFSLHLPGSGGARAAEVLEALLGVSDPSARMVRTFMGMGDLTPMQLDALRALPALDRGAPPVDESPAEAATRAPVVGSSDVASSVQPTSPFDSTPGE
ncbi:MAG: hypothetical protein RLZZ450_6178, partial [Pseudomonadota bacterium]